MLASGSPCVLVFALAASGCGGGSQETAPLSPARVVVAVQAEAPAERVAEEPALAPDVACVLHAEIWPHSGQLRGQPEGPPLLFVKDGPRIEATLSSGRPVAARVALSKSGVHLTGWIEHKQLPLHAARGVTLDGIVVPTRDANLLWGPSSPDAVEVGYAFEPSIAPDAVVWSTLDCRSIGLDVADYDARVFVPLDDPIERAMLRAEGPVALSSEVAGEPKVSLDPDKQLEVEVFERRAGRARILLSLGDAYAFGWVMDQHLAPPPSGGIGSAYGIGGLGLLGSSVHSDLLECDREVPLHARLAGESTPIGRADAGVILEVRERHPLYVVIAFWDASWLETVPGVVLTIPADALDACAPSSGR